MDVAVLPVASLLQCGLFVPVLLGWVAHDSFEESGEIVRIFEAELEGDLLDFQR